MKDPIVDEVRQARMEHTRRFGGDLHLICEDLRKKEAELGNRLVVRKPRKKSATGVHGPRVQGEP